MQKIVKGVFLETVYPGVSLGAIVLERGIVMIDAPPRPDDGRSWQAELRKLRAGPERLLVNLDSHPDRTLGARTMESMVVAQKQTAEVFRQRPAIFKGQIAESGADWETCTGLSGIRWVQPHIVFSDRTFIHWDNEEIMVEHHPGPESGASWVILPKRGLMFVGDAVVNKQPPFLAKAELDAWIESLDLLLSREYKDFTMLSSRGGKVNEKTIRNMRRYLNDLNKRLERLGKRKSPPEEVEKLIPRLLTASESPAKYKNEHSQRLQYGLFHYYARKYYPNANSD